MTQVLEIPINTIDVHKLNPRRELGNLTELVDSIRQIGVLEPVLVASDNGHFALVAGARRLAAAKLAKLTTIPAIAREMTEEEIVAASLIENLQREDLSPLDEAGGYRSWLTLTKKSQADLAKAVGRAPSTIANALRLLEAAEPIQKALREKRISGAHARVAMALPGEAVAMLDLSKGKSVQDLEDDVRDTKRAFSIFERVRAAVEKAKKDGDDVTWPAGEIYVQGSPLDLGKLLGKPPKAIAGEILGWLILPNAYGSSGSIAQHDKACDCRVFGITNNERFLQRVCVSPSGYKKYKAALAKGRQTRTGEVKKRVVTAAQKEAKRKADLKVNIAEATKALAGKAMGYGLLQLNQPANLLAGGLNGEPARIALFGLVSNASHNARGTAWRVELWKQIAALPLKDVRERLTKWAVAFGIRELNDDYKNAGAIRRLVTAHYGPAKKTAKKKAKR